LSEFVMWAFGETLFFRCWEGICNVSIVNILMRCFGSFISAFDHTNSSHHSFVQPGFTY